MKGSIEVSGHRSLRARNGLLGCVTEDLFRGQEGHDECFFRPVYKALVKPL